jgi:STE24 endopeptidase
VSPHAIFLIWLALLVAEQAWLSVLALLNLRHVRRHATEIPRAFAAVVDRGTRARSVAYTLERGRFGLVVSLASAGLVAAAVSAGLLGMLDDACARLPVGPYLRGAAFVLAVSIGSWIANLPFSLYATFSIEARYGFNRTTPRTFALDTLKGLALSLAIGVPVLLGLFWFMDRAGALWWVWAFLALTAFELVMNLLYPLVIAPLFNRFTPLPEGTLRDRIVALADRLGFRTKGIFMIDASRRSRHGNAYFTGFGPVKRIVLFDTLVATMSEDEVLAVLAHEIGHEKRHHVRKSLAISIALGLAGFWVLSLVIPWTPLYEAFGFGRASSHAILVVLSLAAGPLTFPFRPLASLLSRRHEYEADRYAVDGTGGAQGMVSALLRLSKDNLTNLTPHPWYSFYHYSHPTAAERVAALEAYARTKGAPAARDGRPRSGSRRAFPPLRRFVGA